MNLLISKVAEVLADVAQTKVPETGVFQTVSVIFDYPGGPFGGRLAVEAPVGCYGKLAEFSAGKDTTTGHWELGGI